MGVREGNSTCLPRESEGTLVPDKNHRNTMCTFVFLQLEDICGNQ